MIHKKSIVWIAALIGLSAVILDITLQSKVLVSRYAFPILFSAFGACVVLTTFALFRLRVRELEKAETSFHKNLQESEARFERIFNTSPIPLFVTNLSTGKVQATNDSAIRQFGLTGVDPTGLSAPDFYVNPGERADFANRIANEGRANHLVQLRTLSGQSFWAAVSSQKMTHDNSPAILTAIQDVTDQVGAERALRESEQRLTAQSAALTTLMEGQASHVKLLLRAKNPMTTRPCYWCPSDSLALRATYLWKSISSTSKLNVAPGGIVGGWPRSP